MDELFVKGAHRNVQPIFWQQREANKNKYF